MSLTLQTVKRAIADVQAAHQCTALDAITKMQGEAAGAGDEPSLEVLCAIKADLLGLTPDLNELAEHLLTELNNGN